MLRRFLMSHGLALLNIVVSVPLYFQLQHQITKISRNTNKGEPSDACNKSRNIFKVQSDSVPHMCYFVDLNDQDNPTCTCPDFHYRNRMCKHIRSVLDGSFTRLVA